MRTRASFRDNSDLEDILKISGGNEREKLRLIEYSEQIKYKLFIGILRDACVSGILHLDKLRQTVTVEYKRERK